MMKKLLAALLAVTMLFSVSGVAYADGIFSKDPKGYLVLGADLKDDEKAKVLDFLKVDKLDDYAVSYTTNQQEHDAFDSYLSPKVVGSRALSSILMVKGKKGSGISVSSYNITYCTVEMYQNALISAGVEDVAVYIAAPMPASGTCALVSAMNAYSTMTGEEIKEEVADAAVDEIVTTGNLGEVIGDNDKAAELIALLKQQMIKEDMNEEEVSAAIDQGCKHYNITIDEDLKQQLIDLLMKLKNTDIDIDKLAQQAGDLYKKVSGTMEKMGITKEKAMNFFEKFIKWFAKWLDDTVNG